MNFCLINVFFLEYINAEKCFKDFQILIEKDI